MKPSFRWLFLTVFSLLFLESAFAHYDPRVGRWLSRDPIGEAGGLNLYAYCGNDPVNRHDPLGLADVRLSGTHGVIMMPEGNWGGDIIQNAYSLGTLSQDGLLVNFAPWLLLNPIATNSVIGVENDSDLDILEKLAISQGWQKAAYFNAVVKTFGMSMHPDFAEMESKVGVPVFRDWELPGWRDSWATEAGRFYEDNLTLRDVSERYYSSLKADYATYQKYAGMMDAGLAGDYTRGMLANRKWGISAFDGLKQTLFVDVPLAVVPFSKLKLIEGLSAGKSGTTLARELGAAGEEMSGIVGPKIRIPSATGTARFRVPDQLAAELLKDAKNVGELRWTQQLTDFAEHALRNNLRMILDVRQNTIIGARAAEMIEKYGVEINRLYPAR